MGLIKDVLNQYKTYKPWSATKNICYHLLNKEQRKSFGKENPDKTFYIIRPVNHTSSLYISTTPNLLANYFYVVSHLKYAEEKGYVPVVDQLNYPVYNSAIGTVNGIENPWEYFWQQPSAYTLSDAYKGKNVVLSKRSWVKPWFIGLEPENYTNKELISFFNKLSKQILLQQHVRDHITQIKNTLFLPNERILGVSFRFNGHSKLSYIQGHGHPIAPTVEELLEIVKEKFYNWQMDKIFLASDEETSIEKFKTAFGNQLIFLERRRTDPTRTYSNDNPDPVYDNDVFYDTTLSYLVEMELLASCTGLIGSVSAGLRYAVVKNNGKYEHVEIIYNGLLPDNNKRAER